MPRLSNHTRSATVELRHRINAGRVAIQSQIPFFRKLFGNVASDWKEDNSRVTFADFAISERIMHALREDFSSDDFISEEAVPEDETIQLEATYAWVLDPVDGTNNYALGFSACAISLALLRDGEPIYGYVYDHSSGSLIEGGPGAGLLINGRKVIAPASVQKDSQVLIGLHFPMADSDLKALTPLLTINKVRSLGSIALSSALTATGYLGAIFETKGHLWDIAAGAALMLGAGRKVTFQGQPAFPVRAFCYRSQPYRMIAGDEKRVDFIAKCLGGNWLSYPQGASQK
jgi:myo-inositol-1(or 4)-monophosphatase